MRFFRWLTTLAYAGVIFFLSSKPWGGEPLFWQSDKVIHAAMYAGLGGLCVWALRVTSLRGRKMILPLAIVIATLYGLSDEIHQMFVPGRTASPYDLIADGVGALAGAYAATLVARKLRRDDQAF